MKSTPYLAAAALAMALTTPSMGQAQVIMPPVATIAPNHTLLTVNAQGKSTRTPDLAVFTAGVTSQASTARDALSQNTRDMARVIAALKAAGAADRDIQTSNLSIEPVYAPARRLPDGSDDGRDQKIIAYRASNTVAVRQRRLDNYGAVIDALVSAGANQVNGPSFTLDNPDAAMDEARTAAIKAAQARADLYARATGLRVMRTVSIDENGGGVADISVMAMRRGFAGAPMAKPAPVQSGELDVTADVSVRFELAPAG